MGEITVRNVRNLKASIKLITTEKPTADGYPVYVRLNNKRVSFKRIEKPRLTNEDFKKIATFDLRNNITLEVYRDLFLFLCYTGLSFCDAIDISIYRVTYSDATISLKKWILTINYLKTYKKLFKKTVL
ncbi:hypothetical protein Q4Q39_08755 [Flavivirga amylovorans]|uniref:Phage integrase SAM-like domain-containing protein n=1 Tax=Flavivirga amylovorans TaxID=870486 RepID=A0ABT8X0L1_9FLAO|nr:hypothetical protein [Flavivirga amylovorans]MDO5987483.1 hypothetical protein [Flavivirga amylovorans]